MEKMKDIAPSTDGDGAGDDDGDGGSEPGSGSFLIIFINSAASA